MSKNVRKGIIIADMFLGAIIFSLLGKYSLAVMVILINLISGILTCLCEKK